MAKPLPNEAALYKKIKDDKIAVPLFVWDAVYVLLGDQVSFINFQAGLYIEQGLPIPLNEARKMLDSVMQSMEVVHKIIYTERITSADTRLQRIKAEGVILHPLIRDFFTHYLGNDLHIIGMCLQFYLDDMGPEPVALHDALLIQEATRSIRQFLDRLREATSTGDGQ
ncbi:MAG: hypothetical protein HQL14_04815 [Candidatus Omnitrophica bacterium]|nr:hypothetical protein [Candidatus Omnitrophota bacterium]